MNNVSRETITAVELPEIFATALLVIAGKYGNGQERMGALIAAGYDYNRVQNCVNDILKVIGKYG
jgi:hypothetical protein|nr:MAG TPA: CW7 repeat protein [Caudoviricetes sp.]